MQHENIQLAHLCLGTTRVVNSNRNERVSQRTSYRQTSGIIHGTINLTQRGVEKMNSLMDIREAYFKNKVQSLMMKNSVVKTLNKPPMAKK